MNGLFANGHSVGAAEIATGLLASFVLSSAVAWAYAQTHRGFSYARQFVQALPLGALTTCTVIAAIGNSLAVGIGVLGALAIIRFRTQIRDPRDIMFLFACLAIGLASGAGAYEVAMVGTVVFLAAVWYLHQNPSTSLESHEGLARFLCENDHLQLAALQPIFDRCCQTTELQSIRDTQLPSVLEYTVAFRLRSPHLQETLISELSRSPGVDEVSVILHRATVEL